MRINILCLQLLYLSINKHLIAELYKSIVREIFKISHAIKLLICIKIISVLN